LHLLAGIGAVVGPLVFVWTLCRSGESHLPSRPSSPSRERPAAVAAPEPPAARERLTLTGDVVDASGRPVADALVTLVDPEGRGDVLAPGRSREFRDRQIRTDEAGRYRFDDLMPGRRSLVARAGERPPAWTEPFQLDRNLHRTLTLPSPVRLAGLTHPGAKLSFSFRIPGIPTSGRDPFVRTTAADETGSYAIDGLPPSVMFAVQVEASGFRSHAFGPYQLPAGKHFLDFDLETGLSLKGIVRDRAGRPVAGARVVFDAAVATTDAEGGFTLAGLEERSSTLVVSRDGYIQTVVPSVRPGAVEVTLPRAAEVTGRVRGDRARYLCFTLGDARYRMGLGNSETFRIPAVPPGPLRLDIEDAEGRSIGSVLIDAPEGGSVEGVEIFAR
jgi:protocatechuate 3,4-dioxygenase beta subunit